MAEPIRRPERKARRKQTAATSPSGQEPSSIRPDGFVGYADLLLAYAGGGEDELTTVASLLGYAGGSLRLRAALNQAEPQLALDSRPPTHPTFTSEAIADVPFWMPYR